MRLFKNFIAVFLALTLVIGCAPFVTAVADLSNLTSLTYCLDDLYDGFANGSITVTAPSSLVKKNADCVMFWADASGNPLPEYTALANFKIKSTTTTFEMYAHTIIPENAKKLIAYASVDGVLSDRAVSVDLPSVCVYQVNEDELISEFQMISDIHIVTPELATDRYTIHNNAHFIQMLQDVKQNSPNSVGIFVNGDIADHGLRAEFEQLMTLYNSVSGVPYLHISIGNHDGVQGNPNGQFQEFAAKLNPNVKPDTVYYDEWVNGYHYIYLGNDDTSNRSCDANLSDAQLAWLDSLLSEDSKNDPDKPVFVLLHQPIYDTVAGSLEGEGWDGVIQEEKLKSILSKYGQVHIFGGHSHWDLNSPRCLDPGSEDTPVGFNTASTAYLWSVYDYNSHGRYLKGSQGYYVRVYKDKVIYLGRDFEQQKFIPSAVFVVDSHDLHVGATSYTLSSGGNAVNLNASSTTAKDLIYASSNPLVATVDKFGTVTPLQPGVAQITVTALATDTKTIARRTVEVVVSNSAVSPADLPDDFYAAISYRDYAYAEQFVLADAENWVGAGSSSLGSNLWRFTRLSDGTYKITFRGQESQALRQYQSGGVYWLLTEQYQQNAQFHWFVQKDSGGNIYLRCAAQPTQTVSVHEGYSVEKYLYLDRHIGSRTQQLNVKQILDISRTKDNAVPFASTQTIGGQKYILDSNGSLGVNGWAQTRNGNWYYLDGNCRIQTDWVHVNGLWYYLDKQGVMQTGWVQSSTSGLWYYLAPDGQMVTGWQLVTDTWYYLGTDGAMVSNGWQMINGHWYYFDVSGAMQTGWIFVGNWYYLEETGAMHTGWLLDNDLWYYLDPSNGAMLTGGHWINGTYYWFNQSGAWVN